MGEEIHTMDEQQTIAELRKENESLKAALRDCVGELLVLPHGITGGEDRDVVIRNAKAALKEGK